MVGSGGTWDAPGKHNRTDCALFSQLSGGDHIVQQVTVFLYIGAESSSAKPKDGLR
jgi:hypothetical protein